MHMQKLASSHAIKFRILWNYFITRVGNKSRLLQFDKQDETSHNKRSGGSLCVVNAAKGFDNFEPFEMLSITGFRRIPWMKLGYEFHKKTRALHFLKNPWIRTNEWKSLFWLNKNFIEFFYANLHHDWPGSGGNNYVAINLRSIHCRSNSITVKGPRASLALVA